MGTIVYGQGRILAESTVPPATPDGDPLTNGPWYDVYGQQQIRGYNLSVDAMNTVDVSPAVTRTMLVSFTQLTAPGSTADVNVLDFHHHTFQIVVANIDTNVVVRVEGSLDGTNYFNTATGDTTYTANGTYMLEISNFKSKFLRFTFVSEAGGANATIDVIYLGGN